MSVRLRLFGGIAWELGGQEVPVRGRTRIDILLALAEAEGAVVSVSSLLDRFWTEAPASGANAVQRHISALRSDLREVGCDEPGQMLESFSSGYRLTNVETDLSDPDGSSWWLEPIPTASWEHHSRLRDRLNRQATVAAARALQKPQADSDVARLESLWSHTQRQTELHRLVAEASRSHRVDDPAISSWLSKGSIGPVREQASAVLPASVGGREAERESIRQVVGLWADGESDAALDLLDETTAIVDVDLKRRLYRAVVWQSPEDGGARGQLFHTAELRITSPYAAERSLCATDANSMNLLPDGEALAADEVERAESPDELTRALRVDFIRRLAHPIDDRSEAIVDELSQTGTKDGQVEAARFAFVNRLRHGQWELAAERLDEYRGAVSTHWPHSGDDFATMAKASLQRALDEDCSRLFSSGDRIRGSFNGDPYLLSVANAVRFMVQWPSVDAPLSDVDFNAALSVVRRPAAEGLRLLQDHRSGRPVLEEAERLAESLASMARDRQSILLPLAIGRVAQLNEVPSLGEIVARHLTPWSGQVLGLWPVDLVFGRADDWIERFTSI